MSYASSLQTKLILSSEQILSLNSNPVLVIPGISGCLVDLQSVYFRYIHGSTPFNPVATDVLVLYQGTPSVITGSDIYAAGFVDQTSDQSAWGEPVLASTVVSVIDVEGAGVYLTQYNVDDSFPIGANWTDGNGSLAVFLRWAYVQVGGL